VRYHLKITDERGYTEPAGRDGRMNTPEGLEEVKEALAPEQLGYVRGKLEMLAFQTTFDPQKRTGQLGGLNPIATAVEAGFEIENVAESGLVEFERLHSFWQL